MKQKKTQKSPDGTISHSNPQINCGIASFSEDTTEDDKFKLFNFPYEFAFSDDSDGKGKKCPILPNL